MISCEREERFKEIMILIQLMFLVVITKTVSTWIRCPANMPLSERKKIIRGTIHTCVAQCLELESEDLVPCYYNESSLLLPYKKEIEVADPDYADIKNEITETVDKCPALEITENNDMKVVCYLHARTFLNSNPQSSTYTIRNVDSSLCTHVILKAGYLTSLEETITEFTTPDKKYSKYISDLQKSEIKVLISMGANGVNTCKKFEDLIDSTSRTNIIQKIVKFLKYIELDGFELQLNLPKCCVNKCDDNFIKEKLIFDKFLQELNNEFKTRELLLTVVIPGLMSNIKKFYNIKTLIKNVDWITINTIGYQGPWNLRTNHASPVHSISEHLTALLSLFDKVTAKVTKKLLIAVQFLGVGHKLVDNKITGLGAPSGSADDKDILPAFVEFCYKFKNASLEWTVTRSNDTMFYAHSNGTWISYEDTPSLRAKAKYVLEENLGGVSVLHVHTDDIWNRCQCGYFPMLRAINEELRGAKCPIPPCT